MSNLTILERNILAQFGDCEISQNAFFKAMAISSRETAEAFAQEAHTLVSFLRPAMQSAATNFGIDEYDPSLLNFIADRHWNWRKSDLRAAQ